jgi:phage anti-repressor protein
MYLNHNQEKEYIVDLDDIWEWLGFARKDNCKRVLEKNFQQGVDFKSTLLHPAENVSGGRPIEKIQMNIKTYKKLCLKADTKKANDVHDYYIKMEEALHEYLLENAKRQAKLEREKALIESHRKKSVNYFGTVGKIDGIDIGKFGWSNDVWTRIEAHKKELGEDFVLECIVVVLDCIVVSHAFGQ